MVAAFAFILVYLPLCAIAEAQTMSTEEAEAYLAELHSQAMLEKQRPANTKVLEWNSKTHRARWFQDRPRGPAQGESREHMQ